MTLGGHLSFYYKIKLLAQIAENRICMGQWAFKILAELSLTC